jgi:hypothetical protein
MTYTNGEIAMSDRRYVQDNAVPDSTFGVKPGR